MNIHKAMQIFEDNAFLVLGRDEWNEVTRGLLAVLDAQRAESSWANDVDRQGGSFSDAEIARHRDKSWR
jgi:hypothetical protein